MLRYLRSFRWFGAMESPGHKLIDSKDSFLSHRKAMEANHLDLIKNGSDPFLGLLTVEVNTTELCNRTCSFCPRADPEVYPNLNLHMSPFVARRIAENLADASYIGRISFSGYGENLLNPDFPKIIKTFRNALGPSNIIECNTNGDVLTPQLISSIYEAGLNFLYINMYDGESQSGKFDQIFSSAKIASGLWKLRRHYDQDDYGLFLNNRSGLADWIKFNPGTYGSCFYTFYKMMVDYNGNVLFCSNDWGRKHIVGNLLHHPVKSIWLSEKMHEFRMKLLYGKRNFSPCDACNVDGTLIGRQSASHYIENSPFSIKDEE